MVNYSSALADEDLENYTICVLTPDNKIRKMKYYHDINRKLVYIDCIPRFDENLTKIKEGDHVRYVPVVVMSGIPFER